MAQITDLNVAPYYDDFDKEDNFIEFYFVLAMQYKQEN